MYLINQFSKITGLTKKALRYYDEQNILKPSFRDDENQYRMYDDKDLQRAQLVQMLRSFDFSIAEIKETMQLAENATDLTFILQEKMEQISRNIVREKELLERMNNKLVFSPTEELAPSYEISIEEIPPVLSACLKVQDKYGNIGNYMSTLFKVVKGNASGMVMNCYYDEEYMEIANMELCIPVRKEVSGGAVTCKTLPPVRAVCTTHYGSYDTLSRAYRVLFSYMNEKKLSALIPSREIYIKGPGVLFKGNPQKYVMKIILPIEFV